MCRELNRRIGLAKADFISLSKLWSHAALSRTKRLHFFASLIESKLLYSLSCMCLRKADLRRLDGFQSRCIRKIWGIAPAYWSRISNAVVMQPTNHMKASELLLQRQLALFGRVLRAPPGSHLKTASFVGDTWLPTTSQYIRKVGRPRKEWVPTIMAEACQRFGNMCRVTELAADPATWKQRVQRST